MNDRSTTPGIQDAAALAGEPRWPLERVLGLPGQCRGSLMRSWAAHCRRRFGDEAVRTIRSRLGPHSTALPDDPPAMAWLPVGLQLATTDLVIDELLGGDAMALLPMLHEDTERNQDRVLGWVVRKLGPGPVLRNAGRIHPHLFDAGVVQGHVRGSSATVAYRDAALFGNPTFRLLQVLGNRILLTMMRRDVEEVGIVGQGAEAFDLRVAWGG